MAATWNAEKVLLLAHHPFKTDQAFSRFVALQAQEASLEEDLTELFHLRHLGQGHGGQQLAYDEEILGYMLLENGDCIFQSPAEITRNLTRKDHVAHMLTQ